MFICDYEDECNNNDYNNLHGNNAICKGYSIFL